MFKTKLTTTALSLALLTGVGATITMAPAQAASDIQLAAAGCSKCNPCAAKNPCCPQHPCNPCNPCAAKKKNPCNPCAAKNPCNPCNPCAVKKNPCSAS
ncbi:MAG: hypothetical protein H8E36_00670 [Rhodospirillaceae bacterium]|nr:hypothetical protein [Rhodospirillaceae bacterium]